MSDRVSIRRIANRSGLLVPIGAALLIGSMHVAKADTPEYWSKETFRTERPTVVASLSSDDDDVTRPTRRRTPRASITRSENERPIRRQAKIQKRAKAKSVRVASLGTSFAPPAQASENVARGGSIRWVASASCLNGSLRGVLSQVAARFGSVTVNSTCRSSARNRRIGGARRSMHLTGDAADFRVQGNRGAASAFIRSLVGGFKHYGGGLFHIDTGARRSW